jgi:hypothetical protein
MTLGNQWSFPSETLSYDTTLEAMRRLAARILKITADYREPGHPIDINFTLEPEYLKAATEVSREMRFDQPIPKLCTLVTASPFDAAIHDAFGKAHNLNCYLTYGPEFMSHDLARYLSPEFRGEYPSQYLLRRPKPWLWCNHSVGASDPIEFSDLRKPLNDGLPQTLADWIVADGLTHLKIKLDAMIWSVTSLGCCASIGSPQKSKTVVESGTGIIPWISTSSARTSTTSSSSSAASRRDRPADTIGLLISNNLRAGISRLRPHRCCSRLRSASPS